MDTPPDSNAFAGGRLAAPRAVRAAEAPPLRQAGAAAAREPKRA